MSNTFVIGSVELRYAREWFNEAYQNERSLEVALGRWFLRRFPSISDEFSIGSPVDKEAGLLTPVIEVGCVLPYYGNADHEVTDLTDPHPVSRKVDALKLDYRGRNVLSVSTVEHLSSREFGNQSDEDSITLLRKITSEADNYLITWGVGYNATLDAWAQAHPDVPRTVMRRMNWNNEYIQMAAVDVQAGGSAWRLPFGHSDRPIPAGFYNNANGVVVVTNLTELLPEADQ